MMEFLLMLFFAKTVLLTSAPIDLYGTVELKPREPLIAITRGASIEIDVSSIIVKPRQEGIVEFRHRAEERFPVGTIEARLVGKEREVILRYKGNVAYTNDRVTLILTADDGVPTDTEFEKVMLTSRVKLQGVKVSWLNSMK